MGKLFYCKLEFEERPTDRELAQYERDRQLALLGSAVLKLEAGQEQLSAALKAFLGSCTAGSVALEQIPKATRDAAMERLTRLSQAQQVFMREFEQNFDCVERRKQELTGRMRQLDEEQGACYTTS